MNKLSLLAVTLMLAGLSCSKPGAEPGKTLNLKFPNRFTRVLVHVYLKDTDKVSSFKLNKGIYKFKIPKYTIAVFYKPESDDTTGSVQGFPVISTDTQQTIQGITLFLKQMYENGGQLNKSIKKLALSYISPPIIYYLSAFDSTFHITDSMLNRYKNSTNEDDIYYLSKIYLERTQELDSGLTLALKYLKKWPCGKYSPVFYLYFIRAGILEDSLSHNTIQKCILKNTSNKYAIALLFFMDSTEVKNLLKKMPRLPMDEIAMELSLSYPQAFTLINPNDTLSAYERITQQYFDRAPFLRKLWALEAIQEYHFYRGIHLENTGKYKAAISEFNLCDNYNVLTGYREMKEKQILGIYKKMRDRKREQKQAFVVLSYDPADSTANRILKNVDKSVLKNRIKSLTDGRWFKLPKFTVTLLKDGRISNKDLTGKIVVMKFWSIYCPHCRAEIPFENELKIDYQNDSSVYFLAISNNNITELQKTLDSTPFYFHQAYANEKMRAAFLVTGVPSYFIIDKNGIIRFAHSGEYPHIKNRLKREIELAR